MSAEPPRGEIVNPNQEEIARMVLAQRHASEAQQRDMGWLGRVFGSVGHTPGNVAALAVTASFILFAIVLFWVPDTPSLSKKDALTIVAGFISLALGFLFGRTTS